MNRSKDVAALVADIVIRWVRSQVRHGMPPRLNMRLVFGDEVLVNAVQAGLESENERASSGPYFVVRGSSHEQAVLFRNGRPAGVSPGRPIVYVLFWQPGLRGHERNAWSLADLRSVDVAEILQDAAGFVLPLEEVIGRQCDEAANGWKEAHRPRAQKHLRAAWDAVRTCLRQRRGGRERSIQFVSRLDEYAKFLLEAEVPATEWSALDASQRPAHLLRRWGSALPELSLFTLPEIASVLGVRTDTGSAIDTPRKTGEVGWTDEFGEVLAENIEHAVDFAGLGEALAGKRTVQEQLDELTSRVPLCKDESRRQEARVALERFCHNGDESALRSVEWLFFLDSSKRSASLGLKGLLMARGRRAPRKNPLDRAVQEAVAQVAPLLTKDEDRDSIQQWFGSQRNAASADPKHAAEVADVLQALAGGIMPATNVSPEVLRAFEAVVVAPTRKPEALLKAAAEWQKLVQEPKDQNVSAPSLLVGLAHLCAQLAMEAPSRDGRFWIENASNTDTMVLSIPSRPDVPSHELPVGDWGEQARENLALWLQNDVRKALFAEEEADEDAAPEDTDPTRDFSVDVARKPDRGKAQPLGRLRLRWSARARRFWQLTRTQVPQSWHKEMPTGEPSPIGTKLLGQLLDLEQFKFAGEANRSESVTSAWDKYVKAGGSEPGWEIAALVAPTTAAARQWVNAWEEALRAIDHSAAQIETKRQREELERLMDEALDRGDNEEAKRLRTKLKTLPNASEKSATAIDQSEIRSLLKLATIQFSSGSVHERIALTPHHPLVVRLRAVSDTVLTRILRTIWLEGWPEAAADELRSALRGWGLPEPMHAYGFWDEDPLVFEGWIDGPMALFTRLGAGRETDAASLGAAEVARVVERYATLFPAASDRLQLRIRGDREGRWAWRILGERLESGGNFKADVELVTPLGEREPTEAERAVQVHDVKLEAFEPGPEGVLPRVRLRRLWDLRNANEPLHLALLVGDQIEAFQPRWERVQPPGDPAPIGVWDERILFHEPRPSLQGYSFSVGDPEDALCRRVSLAIGFIANPPGPVHCEVYSFDESRCEVPLREQHGTAHWLVMASRQPIYRAVQQAGERLATLLDFYTLTEQGRPVHLCVSLNAQHAGDDMRRFSAALSTLLGHGMPEGAPKGVIRAALRTAPGLAMRCVGSVGAVHLGGLLGLLLTSSAVAEAFPDAVILSLDQHHDLLEGSGPRGDLLAVRLSDSALKITIIESKFTTKTASSGSDVITKAQTQVTSTRELLGHFAARHPLETRTRTTLVRALVHQIHLTDKSDARLPLLQGIVDAAGDSSVPVQVELASAGVIHIWSTAAETTDLILSSGSTPVVIHSRTSLLARVGTLVQSS